jgi:hypothetical protein
MYKLIIFILLLLYFLYRIRIFFRTSRKNITIALDNKELIPVFKKIFLLNNLDIKYRVTHNKENSYDLLNNGDVDFALLREDQNNINKFDFVCGLYKEYLTFLIDNSVDNIFTNVNEDNFDYSLIKGMNIKWYNKTVSNFFDEKKIFKTDILKKIKSYFTKTDGIMLWSHHPNTIIEDMVSKSNFSFFNMILDNNFSKKHLYYKMDAIDINKIYQNIVGLDKNRQNYIKTYSSRVILMCNKNTHKDSVYTIVKNIFDNHRYFEELKFINNMDMLYNSNPILYTQIKIHEGAEEYYKSITKIDIINN